jgi:YVTN family beta-propeller protein
MGPRLGRGALTLLACIFVSSRSAAAGQLLFVTNTADDTVSVIDCDLDREIKVIPVGKSPQGLALSARKPLIAVANARTRSVSLIDPVRLEALPDSLPTGMGPEDVAFSADGTTLFATSYYDKTVTFTDVSSRAPVGAPLVFEKIPRQLLMSAERNELFVRLHDQQGAVVVVDPASRTVRTTIPVGPFPTGMALTSDHQRLLVASFDASSIAVVDLGSNTVVDTMRLDTGAGIVVHPFKPLLYSMQNFDGAVVVADYATHQAVTTIEVGGAPVAGLVTPDGRFLYAVNNEAGNVAKIDTDTNTATVRIAVGAEASAVVLFDPGGSIWRWPAGLLGLVVVAVMIGVVWQRRRTRGVDRTFAAGHGSEGPQGLADRRFP